MEEEKMLTFKEVIDPWVIAMYTDHRNLCLHPDMEEWIEEAGSFEAFEEEVKNFPDFQSFIAASNVVIGFMKHSALLSDDEAEREKAEEQYDKLGVGKIIGILKWWREEEWPGWKKKLIENHLDSFEMVRAIIEDDPIF